MIQVALVQGKYLLQAAFGVHPAIQTLPAYAKINIGETACQTNQ